jgi:type IV pilus assembly protein PilV
MKLIYKKNDNRTQRGFSLIEVLIALVIMSVGMLGIAGLYVQSMQAGRTSMFRHHAVTLAGDVADRIRANPTAAANYAAAAGAGGCIDTGFSCTPAQMAANDILLWKAQAGDTLPGGDVAVVFNAAVGTAPPTYLITVSWSEPGETPSYAITIPVLPI